MYIFIFSYVCKGKGSVSLYVTPISCSLPEPPIARCPAITHSRRCPTSRHQHGYPVHTAHPTYCCKEHSSTIVDILKHSLLSIGALLKHAMLGHENFSRGGEAEGLSYKGTEVIFAPFRGYNLWFANA